ncbi:MAG: hypothetical protein QXQ81_05115 [Candidatus Thorarchaeota archaeon]
MKSPSRPPLDQGPASPTSSGHPSISVPPHVVRNRCDTLRLVSPTGGRLKSPTGSIAEGHMLIDQHPSYGTSVMMRNFPILILVYYSISAVVAVERQSSGPDPVSCIVLLFGVVIIFGFFSSFPLVAPMPFSMIMPAFIGIFLLIVIAGIIKSVSGGASPPTGQTSFPHPGPQTASTGHRRVVLVPPNFCSRCGASLPAEKVDWVGPLQVACPYCGATLSAVEREL